MHMYTYLFSVYMYYTHVYMSCEKGSQLFTNNKNLQQSKLKGFADEKI